MVNIVQRIKGENKPHRGVLENWHKQDYADGYIIKGQFKGHPIFDGEWGHTSMVLYMDGNSIETLNSRYTLGRPLV